MRWAELGLVRIIEPATQISIKTIPLLHRQKPIIHLKNEIGEFAMPGLGKQRHTSLRVPWHKSRVSIPIVQFTAPFKRCCTAL